MSWLGIESRPAPHCESPLPPLQKGGEDRLAEVATT